MNNALAPLAEYRQFIVYRAAANATRPGKMDKLPIDYRTGVICNPFDPVNWTDAPTAKNGATLFGTDYGVGFVLTDDDPFFCLDIDDCWMPDDQAWSPFALRMVERFPGAAVEVSQSGKGLHIWGRYKGAAPPRSSPKFAVNSLQLVQ